MLHFVNTGILGTTADFKRRFETPILRGRDSCATDKEFGLGRERLTELAAIVNRWVDVWGDRVCVGVWDWRLIVVWIVGKTTERVVDAY